eukprot:TRINITY_DN66170_c13_g2_i1.p1 TRINITY_DN66170_c13_g2~~TRINITY_DN66170_c13_g2_i1.p1  ORF type:complete len:468 (-),score=255.24 TRINITY_DN66170_c13_g2_i1:804-2207(-)
MSTIKSDKRDKVKHSITGYTKHKGAPKKKGGGGKGTWGTHGSEHDLSKSARSNSNGGRRRSRSNSGRNGDMDPRDPNYDSDEDRVDRKYRFRVFVHRNDGKRDGGRMLVLAGGAFDMQDLFKGAARKLGLAEGDKPFSRVFTTNGAEAMEPEDIFDGDVLYFSQGEEFKSFLSAVTSPTAAQDESKVDGQEHQITRHQFLSTLGSYVTSAASSLYDSSSGFVKQRAPTFVKVTLEKVEDNLGALATPMVSQVVRVGSWADDKIDHTYAALEQRTNDFLESPAGKIVEANLVLPVKKRVVEPVAFFYAAAWDKFQQLKAKSSDGKVSLEEFTAGVRERLGNSWNDRLVEPTKAFHAAALKKIQPTTESLGKAWQQTVVANLQNRVVGPAETFYQMAVESYATLEKTASDGKVSFQEFTAGMRIKMGQLWNDNLIEPSRHLYEKFKFELTRLRATDAANAAKDAATTSS